MPFFPMLPLHGIDHHGDKKIEHGEGGAENINHEEYPCLRMGFHDFTYDSWKVRFVMPASYTMDTLPKPNNDAVKLEKIPGKRFAVIRFSGMAGEDSLKEHTDELQTFVNTKELNAISEPTYAFFNPPWTLPFLRRNEVMVEIVK